MESLTIAAITLVAAMIGTITGFGTSTLMIPILVIWLPPVEAIFLVSIIHWFGNVWKMLFFRNGIRWKLIALFGLTGLVTSYLGAMAIPQISDELLLRILGIFLVGYGLFLLLQKRFKITAATGTAVVGGSLSGFFAGLFGMGGAIRGAFLSAFDLPKAAYIATAGAIGLMVDSTRIITYFAQGTTLPNRLWYGLLIFIPISLLGAALAKKIVHHIPQQRFRMVIAIGLCLMGLKLIIWP